MHSILAARAPKVFSAAISIRTFSTRAFSPSFSSSDETIVTGYVPLSHQAHLAPLHILPTFCVFDINKLEINKLGLAAKFLRPFSDDLLANFMLGFSSYQGNKGLRELLHRDNRAQFYRDFKADSFLASALFPLWQKSETYPFCPSVTKLTQQHFRANPLLRSAQRKALDIAVESFGISPFAKGLTPLASLEKGTDPAPPAWLRADGQSDRRLLMQMIVSLNLLQNKIVAKNLATLAASLLRKWNLLPQAEIFTQAANLITLPKKTKAIVLKDLVPNLEKRLPFATKPTEKTMREVKRFSHRAKPTRDLSYFPYGCYKTSDNSYIDSDSFAKVTENRIKRKSKRAKPKAPVAKEPSTQVRVRPPRRKKRKKPQPIVQYNKAPPSCKPQF